ncbi:transcriptional regulatory protein ZraR [archaeon BMS3Bbin15]|nr:transcriptional regulatory protein ZraR [archaeon BMS3Bbin15]
MAEILIVDDDREICSILKEILEEEGYHVDYVTSGDEALIEIDKGNYDIVITDLIMPKISGMDFLSYVKRYKPGIEIIMITAFGSIENAVEAMKRGASDYIEKPFKLKDIKTSIKRVLEEAKFKKVHEVLFVEGEEKDTEKILKVIANPIRCRALYTIYKKGVMCFTSIKNELQLEDPTRLSFHLRQLRESNLVSQDSSREYFVTPKGKRVIKLLKSFDAI